MQVLEGIKILDFSLAIQAPLCASMLGDMGAEVIKVERIEGEELRKGRPAGTDGMFTPEQLEEIKKQEALLPDTAGFLSDNYNKRSLAIDVREAKGKEIVLKLAKDSDVFLHNFRPGTMDKLGLAYNDIVQVNPRIIYCTAYGFGATGPLSRRIGGDNWTQALSGVISQMSGPGMPPASVPFFLIDHAGAWMTAYVIMLALFHRQRTGEGQEIWVNQLDVGLWLQHSEIGRYLLGETERQRRGRSVHRVKDGLITVFGGGGLFWPRYCKILGIEHLANDPRFANDEVRQEHLEELLAITDPVFLTRTRAEWAEAFRKEVSRADPCLTYEELCVPHPQVEANEMITTIDHPIRGKIRMLGVPVKMAKTPGKPQKPAPLLGEHTQEILTELGYSTREITELEKSKVIGIYRAA
ncbi:MAG: CoA transferase [Chloroflexi bacterium]|nr:CoA transferase [Chloroflexota bacterium]